MNRTWNNRILAWLTRVFALLFVALNAWGWWDESQARQDPGYAGEGAGDWFWEWAVLTHLLPLLLIAAATIIGWRKPLFGAIGFGLFALVQAVSVGAEWVYLPFVALPPLAIAALYFAGWAGSTKRSPGRRSTPTGT